MQPTIRRRSNGTIDVEYYSTMAENMRREASIDIMRNARPTMWMMVACGAMLFAAAVFGQHYSVPQQALHRLSTRHKAVLAVCHDVTRPPPRDLAGQGRCR